MPLPGLHAGQMTHLNGPPNLKLKKVVYGSSATLPLPDYGRVARYSFGILEARDVSPRSL
jgi:hypothetical protein